MGEACLKEGEYLNLRKRRDGLFNQSIGPAHYIYLVTIVVILIIYFPFLSFVNKLPTKRLFLVFKFFRL